MQNVLVNYCPEPPMKTLRRSNKVVAHMYENRTSCSIENSLIPGNENSDKKHQFRVLGCI